MIELFTRLTDEEAAAVTKSLKIMVKAIEAKREDPRSKFQSGYRRSV